MALGLAVDSYIPVLSAQCIDAKAFIPYSYCLKYSVAVQYDS